VGLVTDLDRHLTEGALVSLSAELKRREQVLAEAGATDIDDDVARGEPVGALPRLVIVIDEFAVLVNELPDSVTGLVGIAQRGRSLGIHLILATQRPSGVVSPEIGANTNLRVALRVTSPAESVDIIEVPDAARISPDTPGVLGVLEGDDPPLDRLLELVNAAAGNLTVVVDDAPLLHGARVAELLEMVARDGPDQGHAMVIAGTAKELLRPLRGCIVEVRQARTGLLHCPESHLHAEVVGARLPRSAVFSQPPRRGILMTAGDPTGVQVPLVPAGEDARASG